MHAFFLVAFVALPLLTWWRSRSISWTVIYTVGSVSIFGVGVNFVIDHVTPVTWLGLQATLLIALLIPAAVAFLLPMRGGAPRRRQFSTMILPVLLLTGFLFVMTTWWTEIPAFQTPVSFLMGHAMAEDNAKWLDFAAQMSQGSPIEQLVPLGGPLQLYLVAVSTLMAVVSQVLYGGVNQVMVAGNTVIYGQFALVALAPLALAPLAEARIPRRRSSSRSTRIPIPFTWTGALVLVSGVLMATAYGHLTWQFIAVIVTLWIATFLVESPEPRARLLVSLAVAAGMSVWLPMNAIAVVIIIGWLAVLIRRGVRGAGWDWIGLSLSLVVAVAIWEPLRSSLTFVTDISLGALGGLGGGVVAGFVPLGPIFTIFDATLFAAGGGVEKTGPLLAALAVTAAVGSAVLWDLRSSSIGAYVRLIPVGLVAGFLVVLQIMDQWATGSAPHYGSEKFAFLVAVTVSAAGIPLALMLVSPDVSRMTAARWVGVGAVVVVMVLDTLLIRSVAAARPQQWSPPIPFDNPRSYWWPADVNMTAVQPIEENPVGCVYLPAGAKAPSGILDSGLSDPQRVYSCTRLLAGLAGEDAGAQPMVDWLRREWLNNERAWEGVYGYLAAMPDSVLDRPVILLDDGSNVIGLESTRSLLNRFPADAWSRP